MSGGPNENDYPKPPRATDGREERDEVATGGKHPKAETLEELIDRIEAGMNWSTPRSVPVLISALRDLALRFKTEMINRGAEESYYENEAAVMRLLKGGE